MWEKAKVTMNFSGRLCGSVPQSKEIVDAWLDSRMPKEKPKEGMTIEEIKAEVLETIEGIEERITLGFQKNSKGLFVRGGTIKAHMKDCANQIKDVISPATKALRAKVANKVYIEEYFVHLTKNGRPVDKEEGEFEQPVHIITQKGPRNALKKIKFVEQPSLFFTLRLLKDKEVSPEVMGQIFEYGGLHGYGGERGMGEGRYTYEIEWM